MNWSLKQRILRHVRIHGGDSNALARAMHCGVQKDTLMTNEKGLFAQAGLRNVRGSTIERKIMSTKTSFKRVSAVTALALAIGGLTSVAANATSTATANIAITGTAAANLAVTAGTAATYTVTTTTNVATDIALEITDPSGNVQDIGTNVPNSTVGTLVTGTGTATLTFSNSFLAAPGKWTVSSIANNAVTATFTSGIGTTASSIQGAIAAGTNIQTTHFYVGTTAPVFVGGTGYSVTSASSISQIAGGIATFNIAQDNADTKYLVSVTGAGSLYSAFATNTGWATSNPAIAANTADGIVLNNGTNLSGGVTWNPASGTTNKSYAQIQVQGLTAGSATVTVTPVNASGVPGAAVSATATFTATGSNGISAATTSIAVNNAACPAITATASAAADASQYATNAITSAYLGETVHLCVSARDSNNVAVSLATTSAFINSLGGTITATTATNGTVTAVDYQDVLGSTVTGAGTFTALLTDKYGNSITKTVPLTIYGSMATLTATNVGYAALFGGSATTTAGTTATQPSLWLGTGTGDAGNYTSALGVIALTAKDAGGNVIDLAATGQSNSVTKITIDSDAVAGSPSAGSSDSAGATVAISTDAAGVDIKGTNLGTNAAVVNCAASTKAEALKITISGKDANGNTVAAAPVTFYCSAAKAAKVTVTASATAGVNVNVLDASGYPVPDGTSVTLAASNGSVVAPSSKTTSNGTFTTAANFIGSNTASKSAVTAIVGSVSGTSSNVAGSGSSTDSQIASLITKINALAALIAKIQKKLGVK